MKEIKLYNGRVTILFEGDEDRHYFQHPDGKRITSVSTFTRVIDKSDALMGWAIKMMGTYLEQNWDIKKIKTETEKLTLIAMAKAKYKEVRTEEANRGKEAHAYADQYIRYKQGKAKKPERPEDLQVLKSITAFLDWLEKSGVKIRDTERFLYSKKYDYAGIIDWAGSKKKMLVLGDHKTSNGIYSDMPFQLVLYWNALEEETKKKYGEGYIVRFGKTDAEFEEMVIPRKRYLELREGAIGLISVKRTLSGIERDISQFRAKMTNQVRPGEEIGG